ncbi:MAG: uracil-DNA glycosylase [Candidatus Acidiferrales bacterium]
MNEETRARVEARLRYHTDLGIHSFYLDRQFQPRATSLSVVDTSQTETAPAVPHADIQAAPPAVRSPRPIIQSPSLFDAVQRVENDSLERIRADMGDCTRCRLHQGRTNIVYGDGNPKAQLVFVGEGPGHDEDVQGLPFVGRAGKLLTQMIEAMGLRRADVYICNVVKCRPPENRTPAPDEMSTCSPFLLRQLAVIQPRVIVTLGSVATQALLRSKDSISRCRGQWFEFGDARLMVTYHPAYLLRSPGEKGKVWDDLKKVMAYLDLPLPKAARASL